MNEINIEISGEVGSGKSTVLLLIATTLKDLGYPVKIPGILENIEIRACDISSSKMTKFIPITITENHKEGKSSGMKRTLLKVIAEHATEKGPILFEHSMDDIGVDSLTLVELIMSVEEEFGIEIPDDLDRKSVV